MLFSEECTTSKLGTGYKAAALCIKELCKSAFVLVHGHSPEDKGRMLVEAVSVGVAPVTMTRLECVPTLVSVRQWCLAGSSRVSTERP